MTENIQDFNNSKNKLVRGINKVADIIRPTYGPEGSNVVIESNLYPGHRVVNDGKVITDSILLSDPIEQMGANMLKEACDKQEKECGDGRKTTVILTAAILNEGLKYKIPGLELKRQLDATLPKILSSIDMDKKEISLEDIGKIAEVASESKEIGKLIGEIYPQIGREGIIEVESSSIPETFYEIVDGMRLHGAKIYAGWQSSPDVCSIENPRILVCKDKIISVSQLEPVYQQLKRERIWEVVLFCEDIEIGAVSKLAQNTVAAIQGEPGLIKTLVIKAPNLFKDWLYEDVCEMTGAVSIDSREGRTFQNFTLTQLGTCGNWRATKEESVLNGTRDISAHKERLAAKPEMAVRLGWLNTKVAILKVGAPTESELTWKIKKTMDAANASRLALKDGVVLGGGRSLAEVAIFTPDNSGEETLKAALVVPQSLLPEGDVSDPAFVIKSAITTAVSLAGIILTTNGAIIIPPEYKEAARQVMQRAQQ